MNGRVFILALFLALLPSAPFAQGFAGLGADAEGFAIPSRTTKLSFPADHGAHPGFRIEWWYLTANLRDAEGREYGIQWTLFRSALAPEDGAGWSSPDLWLGHAALTTPEHHFVEERRARGGIGQAGAEADPFAVWIDEWRMAGGFAALAVEANGRNFSFDLNAVQSGPIILQGDHGYSVKSPEGQASHYYSMPFFEISGTLGLPEGSVEVEGSAWIDREWSSQPLSENQTGWDWFSLHLESGVRLMGFRLREEGGGVFTSATWITSEGTARAIPNGELKLTPLEISSVAGREIPTVWRIELPSQALDVEARALNPNSWMATSFPYWEGPILVTGSHPGRGYLEMTGYAAE